MSFIPVLYALPAFAAAMLIEALVARSRGLRGYTGDDTAASLGTGLMSLVAGSLLTSLTFGGAIVFAWQYRVFELPDSLWTWVALVFAHDLAHYWTHRTLHTVRVFWAGHVTHHSSEHFNFSTAVRESWWTPCVVWLFRVPLALVGFHPLAILSVRSFTQIYQIWFHTETIGRLGPLEWIFMTPVQHRVHHAAQERYLGRNFGAIFVIWDRLFRSHSPGMGPEIPYGLPTQVRSRNWITLTTHEWKDIWRDVRAAGSLREALGYIWMPPGWRPRVEGGPGLPA